MSGRPRRRLVLLLALAAGACGRGADVDRIPPDRLPAVAAAFHRGVGLMEQYRPAEAAAAFTEVVRLAPDWTPGRIDLGLALLNQDEPDSLSRAEEEFRTVLAADPDQPYALYPLGLICAHLGRREEARFLFERVLEVDPQDADSHYRLGILLQDEDPAAARRHYEQALELAPHHESACYRLAGLLRRQGEPERAGALLDRFRELQQAGAGVAAGLKYGEMGRYAAVLRRLPTPAAAETEPGAEQEPRLALSYRDEAAAAGLAAGPLADSPPPAVAVADVDGDLDLDLFLAGSGPTVGLFLAEGAGAWTPAAASPDSTGVLAARFADADGDGDPDLFLACAGRDRFYRNDGRGGFADATADSGLAGPEAASVAAVWADADHDGDLDLAVARRGAAPSLWRNDRDGGFTDTAAEAGLAGEAAALLFADLDQDRDLDLLLLRPEPPNGILLNDRAGRYHDGAASFPEAAAAPAGRGG
ncbi:MAG: tetratricopeptide repeat protein, partial [Planctomycetota bacterium]